MNEDFIPKILEPMPESLRILAQEVLFDLAEELRVRVGQPVMALGGGTLRFSKESAQPSAVGMWVQALLGHSLYAHQDRLREGFVTLQGGHRAGLCGKMTVSAEGVPQLTDISMVCLRIARQKIGISGPLLPHIRGEGQVLSTLIVSPPGWGKTTLLRDLARGLSSGEGGGPGVQVAVADERGEIAACVRGVPQLDLGPRADVMDGCPKAFAMPMLIRSMSPRVVVTDELGDGRDVRAVMDARRCGVAVIASAHAQNYQDALARPTLRAMIQNGCFERFAELLPAHQGMRVLDGAGREIAPPLKGGMSGVRAVISGGRAGGDLRGDAGQGSRRPAAAPDSAAGGVFAFYGRAAHGHAGADASGGGGA